MQWFVNIMNIQNFETSETDKITRGFWGAVNFKILHNCLYFPLSFHLKLRYHYLDRIFPKKTRSFSTFAEQKKNEFCCDILFVFSMMLKKSFNLKHKFERYNVDYLKALG